MALILPGAVEDSALMEILRYLADSAAERVLSVQSGAPSVDSGAAGVLQLRVVDEELRVYVRYSGAWHYAALTKE